jgi:hypothetical protein
MCAIASFGCTEFKQRERFASVQESASGTKRTSLVAPYMSAFGGTVDIGRI